MYKQFILHFFVLLNCLSSFVHNQTLGDEPKTTAVGDPSRNTPDDHVASRTRGLRIFQGEVREVLVKHCLKCHGGGKVLESRFDLSHRDALLKGGAEGPAIVVGDHAKSRLFRLITHELEPHMPENSAKLSERQIDAVARWIDAGAPYESPLLAGPVTGKQEIPWTERKVAETAREHWAFRPLSPQPPPIPGDPAVKHPIDRFLNQALDRSGLTPNPPATRATLIRRLAFDLTGLPPTPEEIDQFVKDSRPDSYERLVQRMLDSPHHGERWARHWLDLARFGESHGFEHDYDRPTAYHYRDFVIRAFNDDLPFDQFAQWQLAGDEIAPNNPQALMATGFLAAGVHSTQITKNEVEKHRYDELDDILATTGTAFLGLSIGCARCHDHKFDPIPAADYYRMLSAFTTTVRGEVDLHLDPEGDRVAKARFDSEHAPLVQKLQTYESQTLPRSFEAWESNRSARDDLETSTWTILEVKAPRSRGGASFRDLPDGSVKVEGKNPDFDVYTIEAATEQTRLTALRLEALADPSLVKGGPGRAGNGNFDLTNLEVASLPRDPGTKGESVRLKLKNPRATFEQPGLPITAVLDDDRTSGWAIDPQFGKDHAAVFEFDPPIDVNRAGGVRLRITMTFSGNIHHAFGRFRLAVTDQPSPVELLGQSISQQVREFLTLPASKRSAEQTRVLLDWYKLRDPGWKALNQTVTEHAKHAPKPSVTKALVSGEGITALRLHTQGEDYFNETYFLRRGDLNLKEGVASLGFLQVLSRSADPASRWVRTPSPGSKLSMRRSSLARWMTDVQEGAGGLLARVIVNRLWQHHLGRGLVATPSDFGTRGEPPSHPELLDWLAVELIQHGWRLKPIHTLILTSAAYQRSSMIDPAKARVDPDNRLLWRRQRIRLEGEVIRDAILAVSGRLDPSLLGPGTLDPASMRRSIYFTVKRSQLMPMMQVFDAPDALSGLPQRQSTTVAPQALLLMNNPQVRQSAIALARRASPRADMALEDVVDTAYRLAVGRAPDPMERQLSAAALRSQLATAAAPREEILADFCQLLFCLNEFVFVD